MWQYIDIRLLSDPEIRSQQLLEVVYAGLHRALVKTRVDTVGISFPGYDERTPTLGDVVRLLGPARDLECLIAQDWVANLRDYVSLTSIAAVPADATFRQLRRVQAKSSPERLRRRQMRRHGLTAAQAVERISGVTGERLRWPFVMLTSSSTGQKFPLFIRTEESAEPTATTFNAYGLSQSGSIPWF